MYISTLDRIDMDKYYINEAASVLVDTSIHYFLEHNDDSLLYCLSKGLYQPILEEAASDTNTKTYQTSINQIKQDQEFFSKQNDLSEKEKHEERSNSAERIQKNRNLILNKKKGIEYLTSGLANMAGKGRDFLAGLLDKLQAKLEETDNELRKNDKDPQKAGMWNSLKSKIVAAIRAVSTKLHNIIQKDRGNIYNRYNADDGDVKINVNEKNEVSKEGDTKIIKTTKTYSLPQSTNEAYTSQAHRLGFFDRSQVRCINESDYGLSMRNEFPMTNRAEVVAAMNNFNIVPIHERAELARNIKAKAHKFNVPIRGSRFLNEHMTDAELDAFDNFMNDPNSVLDLGNLASKSNTPKMPNQIYKKINTSTDNIPSYGSATANHNVEKLEPGYIERFVKALKEYAMKGKQYLLQAIDIANKKVKNLRTYLQNASKDKPTLIKWGQMAIDKILFVIEWMTQRLQDTLT